MKKLSLSFLNLNIIVMLALATISTTAWSAAEPTSAEKYVNSFGFKSKQVQWYGREFAIIKDRKSKRIVTNKGVFAPHDKSGCYYRTPLTKNGKLGVSDSLPYEICRPKKGLPFMTKKYEKNII